MFFSCKCLNWGRKRIKMYFNCEISRIDGRDDFFSSCKRLNIEQEKWDKQVCFSILFEREILYRLFHPFRMMGKFYLLCHNRHICAARDRCGSFRGCWDVRVSRKFCCKICIDTEIFRYVLLGGFSNVLSNKRK